MDRLIAKIIKKKIADSSNGLIKQSYIKGLRPWGSPWDENKRFYTFEHKGKRYRFTNHDCNVSEIEHDVLY